jgi:hypothetical protein
MRLTGLSSQEKTTAQISGRGIRYHFTHRIAGGRYVYPLGTGAAWPRPIPITEVYITCPERLEMAITAPIEGEEQGRYISGQAGDLIDYLNETPAQRSQDSRYSGQKWSSDYVKSLLAPETGSLLSSHIADIKRLFAWHIVYLQSNPAEDISVQLVKRSTASWRVQVAEFFSRRGVPVTASIILYLLCWVAITLLIIRHWWLRAGAPGKLLVHGLTTFFMAQVMWPIFAFIAAVSYVTYNFFLVGMQNQQEISIVDRLWALMTLIVSGALLAVMYVYQRKTAADWRRSLASHCWVCATVLFMITAGMLYGLLVWCETV